MTMSADGAAPVSAQQSKLHISRWLTEEGQDPFATVKFVSRSSRIVDESGEIVFEMNDIEAPETWSQLAVDVIASKYFRKAGVPQPDGSEGPEWSVKQPIKRMAQCWREWGEEYGYFETEKDAQAFEDECIYMLLHQIVVPNSPQWFNTGLSNAYGIKGPAQGHFYVDERTGEVKQSEDSYTRSQPHACFIQSVKDDLVGEGGIMDLWTREARLFKYGSGTGTNFSHLRGAGEPLSGGGRSSGLMSFLRVGDRAAGAIKSGGTTRRAAKMVCLDLDHPEIEKFITWKAEEEKKVASMVKDGYSSDFNGEAYETVSGQNSNNSVRVPSEFMEALKSDGEWHLRWRTDSDHICKTLKARELWKQISESAWQCADPGVQYDTIINDWHTCPKDGRINASNPCSEYLFLDDTACNLASMNLVRLLEYHDGVAMVDTAKLRHVTRIFTVVLEISVLMAQFPSKEIARKSYEYRTLGLGFANLGAALMRMGLPYDSDEGRAVAAAITSIMCGTSYAMSAELARCLGAFPRYEDNKEDMLRVIRNHRRAAYNGMPADYEGVHVAPQGIDSKVCPQYLHKPAMEAWDRALDLGKKYGYRNAQVTVIAPTGTIAFVMDCDTTGIEPDFALVKHKKLAGGGYFKIVNQSVEPALRNLGYSEVQRMEIIDYLVGVNNFRRSKHVTRELLLSKGLNERDVEELEKTIPFNFSIHSVFDPRNLGQEKMRKLGVSDAKLERIFASKTPEKFNMLERLGLTEEQIEEDNLIICGYQTLEGAPHLKDEHKKVFECANDLSPEGHIKMLGACQPFLSGGISKTVNLKKDSTVEDVQGCYEFAYEQGVKCVALYRDDSKMSQVLSSGKKDEIAFVSDEGEEVVAEKITAEEYHKLPAMQRCRKLPKTRHGITYEIKVGGHKVYLRTGEYVTGELGEIFLDMAKEGAMLRSMFNCFAVAISKALQYGTPLRELADTFCLTQFDPSGPVDGHSHVKMATSVIDAVFRILALEYLNDDHYTQIKLADMEYDRTLTRATDRVVPDKPKTRKTSVSNNPPCTQCGGLTIRTGTCYACTSCGASQGCS